MMLRGKRKFLSFLSRCQTSKALHLQYNLIYLLSQGAGPRGSVGEAPYLGPLTTLSGLWRPLGNSVITLTSPAHRDEITLHHNPAFLWSLTSLFLRDSLKYVKILNKMKAPGTNTVTVCM